MARVQRQAIDQDEFNETADRLRAEGKKVSAVTMRQALGGGSYDTIYKYLGIWENRTPASVIKVEPLLVPASVQSGFANAWRLATEEAAAEIQAIKEKCAEDVSSALAQFHGALEAIAQIEDERKAEAKEMQELTARLASAEAEVHAAKEAGARHQSAAEQLERSLVSREADLSRLRAETADEREQHRQAQQQAEARIKELQVSLKSVEEEAAKHKAESLEHKNSREQLRLEKDKAEEAARAERAARDEALKEAAELKGRAEALKQQLDQLLERLPQPEEEKKGKK